MTRAEPQPAYQHIRELRRRILWCTLVLLGGAVLGYIVRVQIISWLEHPLGQSLFYTSPTGSFEFIMRICFLVGFLAALPVIAYHLLRFIEPALPRRLSRRLVAGLITTSTVLMIAGVAFGYFISLPAALHFFNQVGTNHLQAIITADQYFTFVVNYLAIFALVFQLPLLLLFINRITPLGPTKLRRYRKYVFVGSFVVALITPSAPDPLSQIILALPIVLLYEVSIALLWLEDRRTARRHRRAAAMTHPASRPALLAPAAQATGNVPAPPPLHRLPTPKPSPMAHPATAVRHPAPSAAPIPVAAPARAIPAASAPVRLRPAAPHVIDLSQAAAEPYPQLPPTHILDLRSAGGA